MCKGRCSLFTLLLLLFLGLVVPVALPAADAVPPPTVGLPAATPVARPARGLFAGQLPVGVRYARQGSTPVAILTLDIPAGFHAYAFNERGAGKPTRLTFAAPAGSTGAALKGVEVRYPVGGKHRDSLSSGKYVLAYKGKTDVFVALKGLGPGTVLEGELDALLCSASTCQPVIEPLRLNVPSAQGLPPLQGEALKAWGKARPGDKAVFGVLRAAGEGAADLPPPGASLPRLDGPETSGAATPPADGPWRLAPQPMQAHLEVTSLGKALLLGLLAGLILNCMPCVLPVLTLKTSVLFVVGGAEDAARRRAFREHNLLFACGILTQFLILAVGLGAAGLIWGQLFQSVALVTAMLIVVFLLGLSMLGVFTLPVIDLKAGSAASPRLNAYLTGIMATLLATPCSGPLLGGVLSWAFSQPLILLVLVFLAVGVGMSLPYLLFAYKPGLAVYLPRPGAWMGVLERLVGFFLLGTSLYLLSVLPQDRHLPLLAALLVVAAGGWVWGRFGGYDAPPLRRRFLGCAMALLTVVVVVHASQTSTPVVHWAEFSAADVRTHLGKKLILLEFTADWCPSCKFMEQAVFTQERLRRWQKRYQVELVRVDLTRPNPAAEALLQELGSSSIPLTAVFPAGSGATAPLVLRDIFTAATLEQALRRAFDKGS